MNRRYLIPGIAILLLMFSVTGVDGQSAPDTTDNYLSTLPDSVRINALYNLAVSYQYSSLSRALNYADIRLTLANKLNNADKIASSYNLYGNLYVESGLYSNAERYYKMAYHIYDSIGNLDGLSTECHNLGLVSFNRNDTLNCLNYYRESVSVRKKFGNSRRIGDGLTTLGEAYLFYGKFDQSIKNLFEALEYYGDTVAYPRKMDCIAFIIDNLLILSPEKAFYWIKALESENSVLGWRSYEQMIKLRYARYWLSKGNLLNCKEYISQINPDSIFMYEGKSPLKTYQEISEKFIESGDYHYGLLYSVISRELHKNQESHHTANMTEEFKTRLNLRLADEELKVIDEINELTLQRIKIEEYIKYAMIVAVIVLSSLVLILIFSLISIRYHAVALRRRKVELEEAYYRTIKYKERILNTRSSKNVFFQMISGKLDLPFRSLSSELDKLAGMTGKSIIKERFTKQLELILTIGNSIEKSLKRLLMWSKLQRGRYDLLKVNIGVSDYMHELLPEILGMTLKKDIRVRFDIDHNLDISFDRHSLKTIIRIFIENSVEYSDPKSDIIIRGQKARSGSIISVTDYGSGITGWLQTKIFDIDRNQDPQNKSQKLGIGLLIAKQMAEINEAVISFESNEKKGTTFFLHIKDRDG